jgi:hypothetical protein
MSDPVKRIKQLFKRLDPVKHNMVFNLLTSSIEEIERLRSDKARALATLKYIENKDGDDIDAMSYAAKCAIEEITT